MARGAVLIPPAEKRKQAKNRPSLIQRHNAKHREERRAKKHARLVHERDFTSQDTLSSTGHERCWDEYPVDTNERHYAASLHTASPKEIQERLEGTYTKEVLEELLEEQEGKIQAERERKERERKARTVKREADKKFRVPKGGTSNGKYLAYREERPTPRKGKGEFPRWKCGAVGIYDAEGRSFYQTSTRSQHTHSYDSSRSRLLSRQSEKKRKKLLRDSDTIIKTYEHTGVWEKSAAMGGMVWSCCMNEEKDSKGCRARTVFNQSRWNVASV